MAKLQATGKAPRPQPGQECIDIQPEAIRQITVDAYARKAIYVSPDGGIFWLNDHRARAIAKRHGGRVQAADGTFEDWA